MGIFNGEIMVAAGVREDDLLFMDWCEPEEYLEYGEPSYRLTSRHLFDEHYADKRLPEPEYDPNVAWWDWAYLITCHSAQGSEWPHVTVIDDSMGF
jgi:exodeoxyribonuclease-5